MNSLENFMPSRQVALDRIGAVRLSDYARSRNALEGAVTGLSPYITHGFVSLPEVLAGVTASHALDTQHKFVYELGWREYFRHVWQFRGVGIFDSLHDGLLPEAEYAELLPSDIREGATGLPVIDMAVRTLYDTGYLHNHARMWLASYVVHIRKVHWRVAANWLYGHLLDGDLASNHLSWQWVAGTGSSKPYLFNASNVARYAPAAWHSPNTVVDQSYEALDRIARQPARYGRAVSLAANVSSDQFEPALLTVPPAEFAPTLPEKSIIAGRDVWLVHPWSLGELPEHLPADTLVVGIFVQDFHSAWPWSEKRWRFVASRMAELCSVCWYGDAAAMGVALKDARRVSSIDDPHLAPWLPGMAACEASPALFPALKSRCDSFSQWWTRATRGLSSSTELLASNQGPAW